MPYDKLLNRLLSAKLNLLTVKGELSFGQTLTEITKNKNASLVFVKKPLASQMAAVVLARLAGKKFIWIQGFTNPPAAAFWSSLLVSQADRIIVSSKKDIERLKNWGIAKAKIRYQR